MNKAGESILWLAGLVILGSAGYYAMRVPERASEPVRNPAEESAAVYAPFRSHREGAGFAISLPGRPGALAVGPGDRIYLAVDRVVVAVDTSGTTLHARAFPGKVTALDVSPQGVVYAAVTSRISVLNPDLSPLSEWQELGEVSHITSLAAGEDRLYVADAGQKEAVVYSLDGTPLLRFGRKNPERGSPGLILPSASFDLALDPQNRIWLVNPGRHSLERYSADGDRVESWQGAAGGIEGFCGCCNPSHIAVLADGRWVTAEKGIVRIKIYSPEGRFLSVVASPSDFDPETVGLDLAILADDRILVLDPERRRVRLFYEEKRAGGEL